MPPCRRTLPKSNGSTHFTRTFKYRKGSFKGTARNKTQDVTNVLKLITIKLFNDAMKCLNMLLCINVRYLHWYRDAIEFYIQPLQHALNLSQYKHSSTFYNNHNQTVQWCNEMVKYAIVHKDSISSLIQIDTESLLSKRTYKNTWSQVFCAIKHTWPCS